MDLVEEDGWLEKRFLRNTIDMALSDFDNEAGGSRKMLKRGYESDYERNQELPAYSPAPGYMVRATMSHLIFARSTP